MSTLEAIPPVLEPLRPPPLQPVGEEERIRTLDVLRGFALFGILVVNMELFGWPMQKLFLGGVGWTARADVIAEWVARFLFQGKFYLLFSFLFGMGVAVQAERAEVHGRSFGGFFCRRLLVLLGIGLAHALLLWEGDILVSYALCGFLLLAFRKCKPKTLLVWAAVFWVLPILCYFVIWAVIALVSLLPEGAKAVQEGFAREQKATEQLIQENMRLFSHGTIREIFATRARNVLFSWQYIFFFGPSVISMFLLGLYTGKRRILRELEQNRKLIRGTLRWGMVVGLPAGVAYVITAAHSRMLEMNFTVVASLTALEVTGVALSLAYAAGFTLLLGNQRWQRRLTAVGSAGRMALSNYLLQSLVCTTLFYSYGLGWYGSVGRAAGLALAGLIYTAQLAFSAWWLRQFRFGPAEWVWRSLTYGQSQKMRITAESQSPEPHPPQPVC